MSDLVRFTAPTETEWAAMLARAAELGADDAKHTLNYAVPADFVDDLSNVGLPEPDLSGEWADGTTPNDVARYAGLGYVAPEPKPESMCRYFLLCDRHAVGTVANPVLGPVPCCQRCADRVEAILVPFGSGAQFELNDDEAAVYGAHLTELCDAYEDAFRDEVSVWAAEHGVSSDE
jgi:hypothetical protein